MPTRPTFGRIPIWVRVTILVALILAAIAISPVLFDAVGIDGGHGPPDGAQMEDGGHDGGEPSGGHGGAGDTEPRDHDRPEGDGPSPSGRQHSTDGVGGHGSRGRDRSGSDH